MRYFIFLILLVSLLNFFTRPAYAGQPTITVAYIPTHDFACSLFRGETIQDEWKSELIARKSEFERLWATVGPGLIDTTEAITRKSFPTGDFTVRLTLCNLSSQSIVGISVNMRHSLKSFSQTPVPMRYKVDTLFHELLHRFLDEYPVKDSIVLKQHASEPERTRNHLHLLALEKAVLLKRNETDALKDIIAIDSQLPNGYYKRAWQIVNATDTEYLKYVSEISR